MLEFVDVHLSYGDVEALSGIDLAVAPGEIVALLGPSGAGKSTLLHVGTGVLRASKGTIRVNGTDVSRVPAWKRDAALLQETYALYPHLTVHDNVAFPLKSPQVEGRLSDDERERRIREITEVLEIDHLVGSPIQHLSGGQRQRVGLARALVRRPQYLLLDEPLAHLDAKLRHWLRGQLRRRLTEAEHPTLWATPDGKEALSIADRVAVILEGRIVQFATPAEVFYAPATARVAEIVSEPPISLLPATVAEGPSLQLDGCSSPPAPLPVRWEGAGVPPREQVLLGVRAGSLNLADSASGSHMPAQVLTREFTTKETIVSLQLGGQTVSVIAPAFSDFDVDQAIFIDWEGATVHVFESSGERRLLDKAVVSRVASE